MSLTRCPYCEHGNPAQSNFCNACGATLTLAPCPRCGAVNQVSAVACHQCHGELQGAKKDVPAPAPAAEAVQWSTRWSSRVLVGGMVVAALSVAGFYAYRPQTSVALPAQPPGAGGTTNARVGPSDGGAISREAPVVAAPVRAPVQSEAPPAAGASASAVARRVIRPPAGSSGAGKLGESSQPRLGQCTEKVAALGLCTLSPAPKKEAAASAADAVAGRSPPTTNTGQPTEREQLRAEQCTEAVAALGLCTPKLNQTKE